MKVMKLGLGIVAALIVGFLLGWLVMPVKPGRDVQPVVLKGETTAVDA